MKLLVIPARGGSKRLPRKNIKNFAGRPIIKWSIEAGLKTNYFDEVIVSTDDEEIKSVSESAGAKVPFLRPKNISDDYTSTVDVIRHSIYWYQSKGYNFTSITCLYATAPFTTENDLRKAVELYENSLNKEAFVFSATKFASSIQRAFFINSSGFSEMFAPENYASRTQDLVKAYYDAGQFYIASPDTWLKKENIFENGQPYLLPPWQIQGIDSYEDWEMAEKLFNISRI